MARPAGLSAARGNRVSTPRPLDTAGKLCYIGHSTGVRRHASKKGWGRLQNTLQALAGAVRARAASGGYCQTAVPYLWAYRGTERAVDMPETASPYLYLLVDGSIRLHTPSGIMDYVPGQYSISAVDTPEFGRALSFSGQGDLLALAVAFTVDEVVSVILDLEGDLAERIAASGLSAPAMERADAEVFSAAFRLTSMLDDADRLAFMAGHMKREILFYALCGACGRQLLQSMVPVQQAGEIYETNRWIKRNFRDAFTVEELAARRNMSVSAFHQRFKSAVGMGPSSARSACGSRRPGG